MLRSAGIRAAAIMSALFIVAIGWYLGSPLFTRTTLNEPLPTAGASAPGISPAATIGATTTPASTPTTSISHRGQLQYLDTLHNGRGTVFFGVISSCCPVSDRYFLLFDDVAPGDAGAYASVIVWCRAFSVLVTWADFERV